MLTIRYLRTGKKNQPFYRLVVTDKKNAPRGGRFLEIVGFVNPFTKEKQLKAERIKYWLGVGAKASATVHNLLIKEKIIEGAKINLVKKPKKKAVAAKASASAKATADKKTEEAVPTEVPASQSKPAEEAVIAPVEAPEPEKPPLPETSADAEAPKAE